MVFENEIGERGEAALDRLRRAGLALRAVRCENVLDGGEGERGFEFLLQFGSEQRALFERFENRAAAGVELGKLQHPVADGGDLDLVERASLLLAVAGKEGDRAALGEQLGGGGDGGEGDTGFAGDCFEVSHAGGRFRGGHGAWARNWRGEFIHSHFIFLKMINWITAMAAMKTIKPM